MKRLSFVFLVKAPRTILVGLEILVGHWKYSLLVSISWHDRLNEASQPSAYRNYHLVRRTWLAIFLLISDNIFSVLAWWQRNGQTFTEHSSFACLADIVCPSSPFITILTLLSSFSSKLRRGDPFTDTALFQSPPAAMTSMTSPTNTSVSY